MLLNVHPFSHFPDGGYRAGVSCCPSAVSPLIGHGAHLKTENLSGIIILYTGCVCADHVSLEHERLGFSIFFFRKRGFQTEMVHNVAL